MLKRPEKCKHCYAGRSGYPTAIITNYRSGSICNCCGTAFREDGLKPSGSDIRHYMNMVRDKVLPYDGDVGKIRPVVVPLMWSMFQMAYKYVEQRSPTIIATDLPFFLSFGLHNLGSAFGALPAVGTAIEIWGAHKRRMDDPMWKDSLGSASGEPIMMFLTDVFMADKLAGMNPAHIVVLCVEDRREKQDKTLSYPKVFSLDS